MISDPAFEEKLDRAVAQEGLTVEMFMLACSILGMLIYDELVGKKKLQMTVNQTQLQDILRMVRADKDMVQGLIDAASK